MTKKKKPGSQAEGTRGGSVWRFDPHNTQKAIQLGLAVSGGGLPVLWLNLELGKEQLIARILANMTKKFIREEFAKMRSEKK